MTKKQPIQKPNKDEEFVAWVKGKIKPSMVNQQCCSYDCPWCDADDSPESNHDPFWAYCNLFDEHLKKYYNLFLRYKICLNLKWK